MPEEKKYNKRILLFTPKPPFPEVDGGTMAMAGMYNLVSECTDNLHVFSLITHKHPLVLSALPSSLVADQGFFWQYISTEVRVKGVITSFFSAVSYRVCRFFSPKAENRLRRLLEEHQYDIILLESPYVATYIACIRKYSKAKILLRMHNVEYRVWEELILREKNPLKKIWLKKENKKLKEFEADTIRKIDGVIAISAAEKEYAAQVDARKPSVVIPYQAKVASVPASYKLQNHTGPLRLFHIGAMDWMPNQDAMLWFLKDVFPAMLRVNPDLEFHMAGREMKEPFIYWKQEKVFVHGEVASAEEFMLQHDVMIVPVRTGSGIRIKVLDALSKGVPVISTGFGITGLQLENEKQVLLADNTEDFCVWASRIKKDPDLMVKAGEGGLRFVKEHYSREALAQKLQEFLLQF